jgi:hypothetical protein
MKLGIVVIVYNISSEIFLLQMAAIKKFCKDDYVVEVIDNSDNAEISEHIRYHSSILGLNYTKTFAGGKGSSDSHSWASNFAYQKVKNNFENLMFLDHDCLPLVEFSVIDTLKGGHVAAGIGQEKTKKYFWPGLFMLANAAVDKDIVDFGTNSEFGLDTGGNLYKIIEKYGEEACIFFNESYHQNPDFISKDLGFYAMLKDESFLHCIGGSNWMNKEDHQRRISSLVNIIKEKTGL